MLKRIEDIRVHTNLYKNFSIIRKSQKVEITQCPLTDEWIFENLVYPHSEILSAIKRNRVLTYTTI
jgi:hypothetical protein